MNVLGNLLKNINKCLKKFTSFQNKTNFVRRVRKKELSVIWTKSFDMTLISSDWTSIMSLTQQAKMSITSWFILYTKLLPSIVFRIELKQKRKKNGVWAWWVL